MRVSAAVIEIRRDLEISDPDALMRHFKDSVDFINEIFPGFVDDAWAKATTPGSESGWPFALMTRLVAGEVCS